MGNFRVAAIVASVLVGAGWSAANGATILSLINSAPNSPAVIKLHDQSYEYLSVDGGTPGHLDTGDVIIAYLHFTTLTAGTGNHRAIGFETMNDELTAKVVLQVTGKFKIAPSASGADQFKLTFGPNAAFNAALSAQLLSPVSNVMVAAYTQGPDFGNGAANGTFKKVDTVATVDGVTTDGALAFLLGFTDPNAASHLVAGNFVSDNGEGWTAIGSDIFSLGTLSTATNVGSANIGVNRVSTLGVAGTLPILPHLLDAVKQGDAGLGTINSSTPHPWVEFDGHSDLTGSDNSNFAATNLSDFTFTVPEPASLAILALGSLALLSRRRHA